MAAAAPASGGTWPAATSRFAASCGALSHYVRAAEAEGRAQAPPAAGPVRRPLPLMPGADVGAPDPAAEAGPAPAQMTIVYGDQVLVLGGVPADKAAGLLRLATAAARGGPGPAAADLPVARKASLQRFMEKRRGRAAAGGAPYRRPDACPAADDHQYLELAL